MSISAAMQSAVAGLGAQSKRVGSISENIANSATVGYKRTFADMVTSTGGGASGSGVRAEKGSKVSQEGATMSSSSMTDLAIGGQGFFVVSKNPNETNGANYFLTRAGSFTMDKDGYLKNSAGYYLAAFQPMEDGSFGGIDYTSFDTLGSVNVNQVGMTAEASSFASMTGNLPADETGTGVTKAPFVSSMQYVNALGGKESLRLSWQADAANPNAWSVTISDPTGLEYGTVNVTYSDSGATPGAPESYTGTAAPGLTAPSGFSVAADGTITLTIDNADQPQTLDIFLGGIGKYDGITQFAGDYTPQISTVNGSEVSSLANTEIDDAGIVWGIYDNGDRKAMYQIPVAMTTNPDGLRLVDGNAYAITRDSGVMSLNTSGTNAAGKVMSYQLEQSTTDIAEEMTNLIATQRAYSSNAKVITTADEMLAETTNLKR